MQLALIWVVATPVWQLLGQAEVLENADSRINTPSTATFTADREQLFGISAKPQAVTKLNNAFHVFRCLSAHVYENPEVEKDTKNLIFKLSVPPVDAWVEAHGKLYSESDWSICVDEDGLHNKTTVVTVPVYSNDS